MCEWTGVHEVGSAYCRSRRLCLTMHLIQLTLFPNGVGIIQQNVQSDPLEHIQTHQDRQRPCPQSG